MDESGKTVRFACNLSVILLLLFFVHDPGVLQQLCVHLDGGERRLEFVGDGRDKILALGGELHAALRHVVEGNEADGNDREHQKTDEQDEFSAGCLLRGVHLERDVRKRRLQRFREKFCRDVVAFAECDKCLFLMDECENKGVLLSAFRDALVLFDFVLHKVREVDACVNDEPLDEHVCTTSYGAVEYDVVRIDDGLEKVDFRFHGVRRFRID